MPDNFCKFKLCMDVTSQQLQPAHSNSALRLEHVTAMILLAAENSTFLIMEATVCCRLYKAEHKLFEQITIVHNTYTNAMEWSTRYNTRCSCFTAVTWYSEIWLKLPTFWQRKQLAEVARPLGTRLWTVWSCTASPLLVPQVGNDTITESFLLRGITMGSQTSYGLCNNIQCIKQ